MVRSGSKVIGVAALLVAGLSVVWGFGVANACYINSSEYPRARAAALMSGLLAFLCLWLAWRFLGKDGRAYVVFTGAANIIHVALILKATIRAAGW